MERFGKFVLLDEIEAFGVGVEYRAAMLGPAGLDKMVSLLRLGAPVAANADVARAVVERATQAQKLHSPSVVAIVDAGRVDRSVYVASELIEGKSLRAVLDRCRRDGFPLALDHALLICSKVCSALEYAHGKRAATGGAWFHGLLHPGNVVVAYAGDVRVRGFGLWAAGVRDAGGLTEQETAYLAPEQRATGTADARSDIRMVGALLFEAVTGQPLSGGEGAEETAAQIAGARLQSPASEEQALPEPLAEALRRSLASQREARYAQVQEMRKDIDALLFAGDFAPTTFNLAFFMHSLFRADIESESRALEEERSASYAGTKGEAMATAVPPPLRASISAGAPSRNGPVEEPRPREESAAAGTSPPPPAARRTGDAGAETVSRRPSPPAAFRAPREVPGRVPSAALAVALVLGAGGAGYYLLAGQKRLRPPVPAPTLTADAAAAMARVRELEEKLRAIEAEKAAAEVKAAEEARRQIEAQARAKGVAVDAAAIRRAEELARKRAMAEQERLLQEERRRIQDQKRAEEARIAEEQRRAEETGPTPPSPVSVSPPSQPVTTAPAATVTTAPPAPAAEAATIRPGTLVSLSDPGVIPPVADRSPPLQYPAVAQRQRIEGTVELNVLVDERGVVLEVQVVSGARTGLKEAATENVRRRRYRPATKDGIPVKVWMPVNVRFELPR
jgi:serine/threonine-protein kinase